MAFVKGQSGNPGGRPKDAAQIADLARKHSRAAVLRLVEWMKSDNPKASVAAAQALLDRGYGKPQQSMNLSGSVEISRLVIDD